MQSVIRCMDEECGRTLRGALDKALTLVQSPPVQEAWLLITQTPIAMQELAAHPPAHIFCFGEAPPKDLPAGVGYDYWPTPIRLGEIVACISTFSEGAKQPRALCEGSTLLLDSLARQVKDTQTQQSIELTEKELQLLEALRAAEGVALDKDWLLAEIWAYQPEVNTHTLETHLSRLRVKLQQIPGAPSIMLVAGGYCLQSPS